MRQLQLPAQPLIKAMLDEKKAITVATLFAITEEIVDCVVIGATEKASALFGYANSDDMYGSFITKLHHHDDIRTTRLRAILRAKGLAPMQDEYPIRLRRKDGSYRPVVKHVTHHIDDHLVMWISEHEPSKQMTPTPLPHILPDESDELWKTYGRYSIADVEHALNLPVGSHHHIKSHFHFSKKENNVSSVMNIESILQCFPEYVLSSDFDDIIIGFGPGESWPLPDGTWVHHCRHCSYIWHSKNPRPYQCNSHAKGPDGKILCQRTTWWQGSDIDSIRDVRKRRRKEASRG